jgi:hypothetical protein
MDAILAQLGVDPRIWLVVGGLLALVGVFKIISKGLSMALWIVLLVMGVTLANFGLQEGGVILPQEYSEKFTKLIGPGRAMTEQTLKKFCSDVMVGQVGSEAWCQQIKTKPKADWTPNDAVMYTKSCLLSR